MKNISKYYKSVNIITMVIVTMIIASIDNSFTRYLVVSVYMIMLLLFSFYYILKNRSIDKKDMIAEGLLVCTTIIGFTYILFKIYS
jgi:Ca2+/Na+ antiporter